MTKLSHSFSAIKMYENCPKRYYHQRVLKEVKDQGGEATIWGERVHKFLEDRLAKATELPQEVARYDPLCLFPLPYQSLLDQGRYLPLESVYSLY